MTRLAALNLAIVLSVGLWAQPPPAPQPPAKPSVDISKVGPQIGEPVPDFKLSDQAGRTHTVKSLLGPNGAMLVVYRSADW